MLSRVADALFWMSRYVERAEQVARLLDVGFLLDMDLRGLTAGPSELHWTSLLAILQQPAPQAGGDATLTALTRWLTAHPDNPGSIMGCVNRARNNARGIRGALSSEIWRELNKLYWQLKDGELSARAAESPHDFCQAVEVGSFLIQGLCDATLPHDDGWHFIRLGRYLERADKTLRILDSRYALLQELADPADRALSNLQWAGVLKSCLAYEGYQRRYISRVEPECVVEFLLLDPAFPRSVRFCLESAARALAGVGGADEDSKAARTLGRMASDLRYGDLDQIFAGNLHVFLQSLLARCNEVSKAVQDQHALL